MGESYNTITNYNTNKNQVMKITDEMRKFANDRIFFGNGYMELLAIADRIDAEHQKILDKYDNERFNALMDARNKGVNAVLKGPEGFGLIALPKDVDDVRWNIGDKDEDGNEVIAFKLASDGWYVITDSEWPFRPEKRRHYHTPTIEDVLREFALAVCGDDALTIRKGVVEEYAAKLQFKED